MSDGMTGCYEWEKEKIKELVKSEAETIRGKILESNTFPTNLIGLPVELHKEALDYLWEGLGPSLREHTLTILENWCAKMLVEKGLA